MTRQREVAVQRQDGKQATKRHGCPECARLRLELRVANETVTRMRAGKPTFPVPPEWKGVKKDMAKVFWTNAKTSPRFLAALRKDGVDTELFFSRVFAAIGLDISTDCCNP